MCSASVTDLRALRVDQVGSLLRPAWLREVAARYRADEAAADELRAAQDRAIREVIARQEALDFPVLSDGEFRRFTFQDSFMASAKGLLKYGEGPSPPPGPRAGGIGMLTRRLELVRNLPLEEWQFAQALTDRPVKATVISPGQIALRVDYDPAATGYADDAAFVSAIAACQRGVVVALAAAGCRYVQIDAPVYTEYLDPTRLEHARAQGIDPLARLERDLRADNAAIAGVAGATLGIHLCRGNFNDPRLLRTGPYDAFAERAFNLLQHDRFLLEYDTERAGGFEPLRFVPKGKLVVLGLVSTKVPALEEADQLKRRIDEASRYVPLEQLAVSPQCGFASGIGSRGPARMDEATQWRKLELVQRVAAEVWG
jgi:5-methyltetrahydropteroyltriglutamate--homocysteine methyltransferase